MFVETFDDTIKIIDLKLVKEVGLLQINTALSLKHEYYLESTDDN